MIRKMATAAGLFGITVLPLVVGCPQPAPTPGECAEENQACSTSSDCCTDLACEGGLCVAPGAEAGTARLPAKNIALNLIGIHDSDSDDYNGNCIGCHGDRTGEVSADGTTPTAHSVMLTQFGEGNDRCTTCHPTGPDFLTYSRGGLREQVDMEQVNCATCHGLQSTPSFYAG